MLVLFETPAGYTIFKVNSRASLLSSFAGSHSLAQVLDDSKLKQVDSIYEAFSSADKANKIVKLKVSTVAI
jgi:hypothetical protein